MVAYGNSEQGITITDSGKITERKWNIEPFKQMKASMSVDTETTDEVDNNLPSYNGKRRLSIRRMSDVLEKLNFSDKLKLAEKLKFELEKLKLDDKKNEEEKSIQLKTFQIPDEDVMGSKQDQELGLAIITAWISDGILQIALNDRQKKICADAMKANEDFVRKPLEQKKKFVSVLSYSGYISSKEEKTGDEPDAAEIFTITKDVGINDQRVKEKWPCHGPVYWPDYEYRNAMTTYMNMLGELGEKILKLVALGFQLPLNTFTQLTIDGWHHMRVLHFPDRSESQTKRGIGAHTDYGMLVLANQDTVGGLFIRPPIPGEWRPRNWLPSESAASLYEGDDNWYFVPPCSGTLTCFAGDTLQYLTNDILLSTPHKVRLNTRERFALAYFHEPNFNATIRPIELLKGENRRKPEPESIHYGTHFTNMFMRCYPDRVTTQRIKREGGLEHLKRLHDGGANCMLQPTHFVSSY